MTHRKLCSILLALLLLAGCDDDAVSPGLEARAFSLLGGFDPGQVLTLEGADVEQLFLAGGVEGARYLIVPFFADDDGRATLQVEIEGTGLPDVPSAQQAPTPGLGDPLALRGLAAHGPRPVTSESPFHQRLREWERTTGARMLRSAAGQQQRELQRTRMLTAGARTLDVPRVGEILDLRVISPERGASLCEDFVVRPGRVVAVNENAVLVVDTMNPAGGAVDEELIQIAEAFDELIYPVNVRNFGEPTDIDDNGRVIIFITSVVNELTPPGSTSFTAGFFFGGDLFPNEPGGINEENAPDFICDASNEAEIFYIIAPDPAGELGNVRRTEDIVESTPGIITHEMQHLINASRRLYVNPGVMAFEEVWLNEGLSHIAEELTFYAATPLGPRRNLGAEELTASADIIDALLTYGFDNIARLFTYLRNPDAESLLGIDNLPTRGAAWAFLRYAADQEPGPDQQFWFDLVNSQTSGVANLNTVLEVFTALDLMQTWTASVYTDDTGLNPSGPLEPVLLEQPSWNFREIFTELTRIGEYPLATILLTARDPVAEFDLRGGGAAFVLANIDAGEQARLDVTSGGVTPTDQLRVTVIRIR